MAPHWARAEVDLPSRGGVATIFFCPRGDLGDDGLALLGRFVYGQADEVVVDGQGQG